MLAPVIGLPEDQQSDHAECGSLNCTAVCRTAHPTVTIPATDNTSAQTLQRLILTACPDASTAIVYLNLQDAVNLHVPLGRYVIGLVHCTGQAVPCPPAQGVAAHWITVYQPGGAYYQCWTATLKPDGTSDLRVDSDGLGPHLAVWFPAAPPQGDTDVYMYSRIDGTVYLLTGAGLVPLGSGPDETYLRSLTPPVGTIFEAKLTLPFQVAMSKIPIVGSAPGGAPALTVDQAADLAAIPALAAAIAAGNLTLAHIEAALKGA